MENYLLSDDSFINLKNLISRRKRLHIDNPFLIQLYTIT